MARRRWAWVRPSQARRFPHLWRGVSTRRASTLSAVAALQCPISKHHSFRSIYRDYVSYCTSSEYCCKREAMPSYRYRTSPHGSQIPHFHLLVQLAQMFLGPFCTTSLAQPSLVTMIFTFLSAAATLAAPSGTCTMNFIGSLGCKINSNRVAYWTAVPGCDNLCIQLSYQGHTLSCTSTPLAARTISAAWNYREFGVGAMWRRRHLDDRRRL
ncbi:hypothetical protein EXIGLDRAFT_320343 [Exidia glandulosa HHB12029]|uniref:Uncharacterized protein n=1 Tax=Exidia glandulosa HHB12029 TaxID=1314781 RepID=A0A165Q536_EXIGL|nr:hypothetical protein EXIGLDRAFT_320343 [Exidia glandulosa HHB12029]